MEIGNGKPQSMVEEFFLYFKSVVKSLLNLYFPCLFQYFKIPHLLLLK